MSKEREKRLQDDNEKGSRSGRTGFHQTVYLGFYLPGERIVLKAVGDDGEPPPPAVTYRLSEMLEQP